jgi:hypothetical protein
VTIRVIGLSVVDAGAILSISRPRFCAPPWRNTIGGKTKKAAAVRDPVTIMGVTGVKIAHAFNPAKCATTDRYPPAQRKQPTNVA